MLPEVYFCEPAGEFVAKEHADAEQEGWEGLYCQGDDCCENWSMSVQRRDGKGKGWEREGKDALYVI